MSRLIEVCENVCAAKKPLKINTLNTFKHLKLGKNPNLTLDGNIIIQYGGGALFKPGSYDRYTPFKLYPDADFLVTAWPMGLVQASCNPFKKDRALKGVNLADIAQEVLLSKIYEAIFEHNVVFPEPLGPLTKIISESAICSL